MGRGVVGGCGLRFALETGKGLKISGYFVRQKLESDEPVKPSVFGFVHHPHASAAKLLNDTVVRDCLADQLETPSLRVDSSYGRGSCQSTKEALEQGASDAESLCCVTGNTRKQDASSRFVGKPGVIQKRA